MTKYESFCFTGKPKYIKKEDVSSGQKITFHCNCVKFCIRNLKGFFEDCDIIYYTDKGVSITQLQEADCITLEGIVVNKIQSKDKELIALIMRTSK